MYVSMLYVDLNPARKAVETFQQYCNRRRYNAKQIKQHLRGRLVHDSMQFGYAKRGYFITFK
jgi:hypothetical protein